MHAVVLLVLESWPLNMVFAKLSSCLWKGLIQFGFKRNTSSSTKYNGILMLVPRTFLCGVTCKSLELNAFPKLDCQKHCYCFHVRSLYGHEPGLTAIPDQYCKLASSIVSGPTMMLDWPGGYIRLLWTGWSEDQIPVGERFSTPIHTSPRSTQYLVRWVQLVTT